MKIGLIELDFHVDSVDGICKVFEDSGHELLIFTTNENHRLLSVRSYFSKHQWFTPGNLSKSAFLNRYRAEINGCDGIFINTISSDFKVFSDFEFRPLTMLRVHNAYKMFAPFRHIKIYPNARGLFKALSYFIREVVIDRFWYYRPRVVSKIDYFTFPDESIKAYLLSKNLVPLEKIGPVLPIKVFDETVVLENEMIQGEIHICIPGGVDRRRRLYEPVVEAFREVAEKTPIKVKLHLLGRCNGSYGAKIIKAFLALQNDRFELVYHSNFVSQKDFDETMRKTNLVIAPVNPDALTQLYGEIYGKTKISGSMTDIVLFPKPLILPLTYPLSGPWKDIFFSYRDSRELSGFILGLIDHPEEIKDRTQAVYHAAKSNFDKKKILRSITDFYTTHKK